MSSQARKDEPQSFTEARARLDAILEELEADTGDVDQVAERVREASRLIRFCRERLAAARHEVTSVVAELAQEEQAAAGDADEPDDEGEEAVESSDDGPDEETRGRRKGDLPF